MLTHGGSLPIAISFLLVVPTQGELVPAILEK